jgi:hypothetical protein
MEDQILFELPVEMELRKSEDGEKRIIRGYASTERMDQDGEVILQSGIDFGPLLKSGFLNYDHQYRNIAGAKLPIIIGYPTKAEIRDKGLWVEGELLKSDNPTCVSEQVRLADEMWELGMALQKSGTRSLAYSVEGAVLERHGKKIMKSVVRHLAVTHKPVNPEATIELFAKSMCCGRCQAGHPLHIPGHTCESHQMEKAMSTESAGPMLRQNLDRGLTSVLYGGENCGCYYPSTGRFKNGIHGAVEHLVKCQGYGREDSIKFLRKIVHGAAKEANLAALVKQAGLVSP